MSRNTLTRTKKFVQSEQKIEYSDEEIKPTHPDVPKNWIMGSLLNVRPGGEGYIITLYPEEYDYRHPEKAMIFVNYGQCQDFVSQWYARTWVDPRA